MIRILSIGFLLITFCIYGLAQTNQPSQSTELPKITSKPAANFTREARENNLQGIVQLRVTFKKNGKIGKIKVVRGIEGGLTEQAVAAAKQIKFEPARKNGKPVTVTKLIEYTFTLY